MKRLTVSFLIASIFIFSMQSQTIDGDMIVAGDDELPAGYFVKAAGYLPGDVITLTNSYTGEDVQLLNLGTLDGSGGVAMIISKESAGKLGMTRATSTPVRLEARSGSYDESASGRAVVSKVTPYYRSVPDENASDEDDFLTSKKAVETPSPADEFPENAEKLPQEEPSENVQELEEKPPVREEPKDERVYEAFNPDELPPDTEEKELPEKEPEPEPEVNEPVEDAAQPAEDMSEAFNPDALSDIEDETPRAPEKVEGDLPGEEVKDVEPEAKADEYFEGEPETGDLFEDETLPEEPVEVEPVSEEGELTEDLPGENVLSVEPSLAEKIEVPETDEEPSSDLKGEEVISIEPVPHPSDDLPGEDVASVEPAAVPSSDAEGEKVLSKEPEEVYEGIVLVPASPLPPAELEAEPEPEPETDSEPETESEPEGELVEETEIEPVPEPVEEEPVKEPVKEEVSEVDVVLARTIKESDLKSGAFYIQIATFSKKENAANAITTYEKYPLCVIENTNGSYKVLVGPLNEDEYGAALLRFKSFGFKDAFVRKIK